MNLICYKVECVVCKAKPSGYVSANKPIINRNDIFGFMCGYCGCELKYTKVDEMPKIIPASMVMKNGKDK